MIDLAPKNLCVPLIISIVICGCGERSDDVELPDKYLSEQDYNLEVKSPEENSLWFASEPIPFDAQLLLGNQQVDSNLEWSSSVDGELGISSSIVNLSKGVHFVTVSATHQSNRIAKIYSIAVVDQSELTEALILGSGPLATRPSGCARPAEWSAWENGTSITVNLSKTISDEKVLLAEQFTESVVALSNFGLNISVVQKDVIVDNFSSSEVNIVESDSPLCPNGFACSVPRFNPDKSIDSYVIRIRSDQPAAVLGHELGHALLGLCHINGASVLARNSIMSAPTEEYYLQSAGLPTRSDALAFQSVYFSGASPGDGREELILLGVLAPD